MKGNRFLFFPLFAIAFFLLGGLAVMLLWNAILPPTIASVGALTYWRAVGLLILCKILFGGFRGKSQGRPFDKSGFRGSPPWKEKMMNMTEEEREKFKAEWKERCGRK